MTDKLTAVKFTVRVKDMPTEIKEGMGKGVVAEEYWGFPKNASQTTLALAILRKREELLNKYFEVEVEEDDNSIQE